MARLAQCIPSSEHITEYQGSLYLLALDAPAESVGIITRTGLVFANLFRQSSWTGLKTSDGSVVADYVVDASQHEAQELFRGHQPIRPNISAMHFVQIITFPVLFRFRLAIGLSVVP